MNMRKTLVAICLGAASAGAAFGETNWKSATDGDLAEASNWDADTPPFSETKPTEANVAVFNFADADLHLTLGRTLWFYAFNFGKLGKNSTYTFDLRGNTLKLCGDAHYPVEIANNGGGTIVLTNGTVVVDGTSRSGIPVTQASAHLILEKGAAVGGAVQANVKNGGSVELRNGSSWTGHITVSTGSKMTISGPETVFTGSGDIPNSIKHYQVVGDANAADAVLEILDGATVKNACHLWCGANGYRSALNISNATVEVSSGAIVVGSAVTASNNTVCIGGGTRLSCPKGNTVDRTDIAVGMDGGGNAMFIAGEGTTVTNLGDKTHGVMVGARSSDNTLVVSDGAELYHTGWFGIGAMDSNDTSRGPVTGIVNEISNNRVVVRDGARLVCEKSLVIGQMAARSGHDYEGVTCAFSSNVLEVVRGSVASFGEASIGVATNMDHCAVRVSGKGSSLSCGNLFLGTAGSFCELEISDGATANFSSKFNIGGLTSTGATVRITGPGTAVTHTSNYMSYQSATDGGAGTTLEVSDGAVFRTGALNDASGNIHLVVSNATIEVGDEAGTYYGTLEFTRGAEITFAGESPTIREMWPDRNNHLGFYGGTIFHFQIPRGGYKTVPFDCSRCVKGVALTGSPKATFDVEKFAVGGGGYVVLISANGGFSLNNQTMSETLSSLSENLPDGCALYFANGDDVTTPVTAASKARRLVLKVPNRGGMMILFR